MTIGFRRQPKFEPLPLELHFKKEYGSSVHYELYISGTNKPNIWIPKELLPSEGYPETIRITIEAAPNTRWKEFEEA